MQSGKKQWFLHSLIFVISPSILFLTSTLFAQNGSLTFEPAGHFGGTMHCSAVQGVYAFLGQGDHLVVLDISGSQPEQAATLDLHHEPIDVFIAGEYAFLYMAGDTGLQIVDISSPLTPMTVGFAEFAGNANGGAIFVSGDYAYIAAYREGLFIIDISNPASPNIVQTYTEVDKLLDVYVDGDHAYLLDDTGDKLRIMDVSDPATPTETSTLNCDGPWAVHVKDNYVYVAELGSTKGMRVVDVSNPAAPVSAAYFETRVEGTSMRAHEIFIAGNTAYVGAYGFVNSVNQAWLFAIDITDPVNPTELGKVRYEGNLQSLQIELPYAYLSASGTISSFQMINISDPANAVEEKEYISPGNVTNLQIHENYLLVSSYEGFLVYDISTRDNPIMEAAYADWQPYNYTTVRNNILFGTEREKLYAVDISDLNNIQDISGEFSLDAWGTGLISLGDFLYIPAGNKLEIINVSNPAAPVQESAFDLLGEGKGISARTEQSKLYIAYHADNVDKGLQILDVSSPVSPVNMGAAQTSGSPTCITTSGTSAFVGSNTGNWNNSDFFLESFDISNPGSITRQAETGENGYITSLFEKENIVYAGVVGQSIFGFQTLTMQLLDKLKTGGTASMSWAGDWIFSAEGHPDDGGSAYGTRGIGVTKTVALSEEQGQFTATVRPVADAGTVAPVHAIGPVNSTKPVVATANPGWEFLNWINASPVNNPSASAILRNPPTVVIANFTPVLLVAGQLDTFYCATMEHPPVPVLDFTLTAGNPDDWEVTSLEFRAWGNGDEKEDITSVMLYQGNSKVGMTKEFNQDNGKLKFTLSGNAVIDIPAGESRGFTLHYAFKNMNTCPDTLMEYNITLENLEAKPKKYPPGTIRGAALGLATLGCVWNKQQKEGYLTIQNAVDNAQPDDDILVCPGTYSENVKVSIETNIRSVKTRTETIVVAKDPNQPVFYLNDFNIIVQGFTIKGATQSIGVLIQRDPDVLDPKGSCGVVDNFITENKTGCRVFRSYNNWINDNIISGNTDHGIFLEGPENNLMGRWSDRTTIKNNYIGTNENGTEKLSNRIGIYIYKSVMDEIGGTEGGGDSFLGKNVISGNSDAGIYIEETKEAYKKKLGDFGYDSTDVYINNQIIGNFIGTNAEGTGPLPNGNGIVLKNCEYSLIGSSVSDEHPGERNLISGNSEAGIRIEQTRGKGTHSIRIWGNYIGTDISGTKAIANKNGIHILELAGRAFIGKIDSTGCRNLISGNIEAGIKIDNGSSTFICGNYIGTTADGSAKLPNRYGIFDHGGFNTAIGYPNDWQKDGPYGNLISGNTEDGIRLEGSSTVLIQGNFIGVGVFGTSALPNKNGIFIKSGSTHAINIGYRKTWNNTNTYTHEQSANLISGNLEAGIKIEDCRPVYFVPDVEAVEAKNIFIDGNEIGINRSVTDKLANQFGIYIKNSNRVLIMNNSIGGNSECGIKLESTDNVPVNYNKIYKNRIGTVFSSKSSFGNGIGVALKNSENNQIFDNDIWYNCKAYHSENATANTIEKNDFKANSCNNTGIHLINATPIIVENTITQDAGDAIRCEEGSNPQIKNNNIFNNEGFGLNNLDETITIDAQGNYWGDNTGPGGEGPGDGEEISGQIDYEGWLEKPNVVLVTFENDTLFIPEGVPKTIPLHFQNWLIPDDILDVTITDSLGWLEDPSELTIELIEDEEADTIFTVSPPLEAEDMRTNIIKIDVRSQTDPSITYLDTILAVAYRQLAHTIIVKPDSLVLEAGDRVLFSVTCYDQFGRPLETDIEWSVSGGTIDTAGVFIAGEELGDVTITATNPETGIFGMTVVQIIPSAGIQANNQNLMPLDFFLSQNYPNPFNPQTTISYGVKDQCHVDLIVYDIRGREVIKLVDETKQPGYHQTTFNAGHLASGLYLYRIQMKDFVKVKKMVLLE